MKREDIIRMAQEVGLPPCAYDDYGNHIVSLEAFANLVAEAEREACARTCDKLGDEYADANAADCAFAIRERGAP